MNPIALGIIIGLLTTALFLLADTRTEIQNEYSNCVYHEARADGFKGTDAEAWELYQDVCAPASR